MGRQVRTDQGRRLELTFQVTKFDAGQCVVFEGVPDPFRCTFDLQAMDPDAKTHLTFTFEGLELRTPYEAVRGIDLPRGSGRCRADHPQHQTPDRSATTTARTRALNKNNPIGSCPMAFVIEKDPDLIPEVLSTILDSTSNGITWRIQIWKTWRSFTPISHSRR